MKKKISKALLLVFNLLIFPIHLIVWLFEREHIKYMREMLPPDEFEEYMRGFNERGGILP